MKKLSHYILSLFLMQTVLYGAGPFNLEGIDALNILVIDENKAISQQLEEKLREEIKQKLEKNGITCGKETVGALFVKVSSSRIGDTTLVHINFGVGEEAEIVRSHKVESFVISYSNEDTIESDDVEADVYDSVINFLMEEFLTQFREDNEE